MAKPQIGRVRVSRPAGSRPASRPAGSRTSSRSSRSSRKK